MKNSSSNQTHLVLGVEKRGSNTFFSSLLSRLGCSSFSVLINTLMLSIFVSLGASSAYGNAKDSIPDSTKKMAVAYFAGGCFWCMEEAFEKIEGVTSAVSGYTDGVKKSPTYKEVASGKTKYTEAVKVSYDPKIVSYEKLLGHFWKNVDPTAKNRQFCDSGTQYRSGIYPSTDSELKLAKSSLDKVRKLFKEVHTEVKPFSNFVAAEGYHQDYYTKNPARYKFYKFRCGRTARLEEIWKGKIFP